MSAKFTRTPPDSKCKTRVVFGKLRGDKVFGEDMQAEVLRGPPPRELQRLLDNARRHGEKSEPEHEVGDLQQALWALWNHMRPEDRAAALADYWALHEEW